MNKQQPPAPGTHTKPMLAFGYSLIGGITTLIIEIFALTSLTTRTYGFNTLPPPAKTPIALFFLLGTASSIMIIYGATLQNSTDQHKIRTGSILIITFTILAAPGSLYGFFIGGPCTTIGGLIGLTWKPTTTPKQQPTSTNTTQPQNLQHHH
ncbi:MAG: hypothetical protein JRN21_10060 [Nitrososphaerota archaeon]|nr:hypothetical protein [Nitrososphaerota archaeon]